MKNAIYILLIVFAAGCAALETKFWPPPEASLKGNFTPLKVEDGDFRFITAVRVQKADVALFRYVCLYKDVAQTYERVGIDNHPVPVASDTMRVDCRNVLSVEMEVIRYHRSKHQKSRYVYFKLPIYKWTNQ